MNLQFLYQFDRIEVQRFRVGFTFDLMFCHASLRLFGVAVKMTPIAGAIPCGRPIVAGSIRHKGSGFNVILNAKAN
jgi:hypothetical protein